MKYILPLFIILLSVSCKKDQNKTIETPITYSEKIPNEVVVVANPIVYDVTVKSPYDTDEYLNECLKNTYVDTLVNYIFEAIYNKKLIPYHYWLKDSIIPIDSVKNLEKIIRNKKIAKMTFDEQWYFSPDSLQMYKKVNSIIIGYESKNEPMQPVLYKALFKIYLNKKEQSKIIQ